MVISFVRPDGVLLRIGRSGGGVVFIVMFCYRYSFRVAKLSTVLTKVSIKPLLLD